MEEVEKSIIEFCDKKSKHNYAIYLSDIIRYLRDEYDYTINESILIIDECIVNEYLEIKEIEWKKWKKANFLK